jgi:hypothetical protein
MSRTDYLEECQKRQFDKESAPDNIRERIDQCINEILQRYPNTKSISLTGSYASGAYIDNDSTLFMEIKTKYLGRSPKISDIDFLTEPRVFNFFTAENGFNVHCCFAVYPGTHIIEWLI